LDFDAIEVAEGSAEYEEWHKKLGFQPLGEEAVVKAKERVKQLKIVYGDSFTSPFGWARCALGPDDGKGFKALERAVRLDHWRPAYRGACHSIHATPRRVFFSFSQPEVELPILAVGPSNYGLADPGQNAVLSLVQLTSAFMLFTEKEAPIDLAVVLRVMMNTADTAAGILVDIHHKLEQELKDDDVDES